MPESPEPFIHERPDPLAKERERLAEARRGVNFELGRDDMEGATVWLREMLDAAEKIRNGGG